MFSIDELREANDELKRAIANEEGIVDTGIAGGVLVARIRSSAFEHLVPESVFGIPVSISVIGDYSKDEG